MLEYLHFFKSKSKISQTRRLDSTCSYYQCQNFSWFKNFKFFWKKLGIKVGDDVKLDNAPLSPPLSLKKIRYIYMTYLSWYTAYYNSWRRVFLFFVFVFWFVCLFVCLFFCTLLDHVGLPQEGVGFSENLYYVDVPARLPPSFGFSMPIFVHLPPIDISTSSKKHQFHFQKVHSYWVLLMIICSKQIHFIKLGVFDL